MWWINLTNSVTRITYFSDDSIWSLDASEMCNSTCSMQIWQILHENAIWRCIIFEAAAKSCYFFHRSSSWAALVQIAILKSLHELSFLAEGNSMTPNKNFQGLYWIGAFVFTVRSKDAFSFCTRRMAAPRRAYALWPRCSLPMTKYLCKSKRRANWNASIPKFSQTWDLWKPSNLEWTKCFTISTVIFHIAIHKLCPRWLTATIRDLNCK